MLAPGDDPLKNPNYFEGLRFPLYCSPKLDGIRCIVKSVIPTEVTSDFETIQDHSNAAYRCVSRKFLPLPSRQLQEHFSSFYELDGEIIVGEETDFDVYNRTQSYVMSDDKPAVDIKFRVFDCADEEFAQAPFEDRLSLARDQIAYFKSENPRLANINVSLVEHTMCEDLEALLAYEDWALQEGYEGIMMRDPLGRYKWNRGTFKEGLIYKLKRFQDDEALIIGFEEANTNTNEKVKDELGNAKRSTAQAGLVPSGTLGKFIVDYQGLVLEVAPGASSHSQRQKIWDDQERYMGRILTFRHFAKGVKDMPRFPRFVGFRDPRDIGEL